MVAHPFADLERVRVLRLPEDDPGADASALRALLEAAHDEVERLHARNVELEEKVEEVGYELAEASSGKTDVALKKEVAALKKQNKKLEDAHKAAVKQVKAHRDALFDAAQVQAKERVELQNEVKSLRAAREEFDRGAQRVVDAARAAAVDYERLKKESADLKECEAFMTAFAMLVGVGFDYGALSDEQRIFIHGACVALGREDLLKPGGT